MKKHFSLVCATIAAAVILSAAPQDAPKPKEGAGDAAKGDVAKGKETFEQCSACHNTDTDEKKMGPSLMGLYKKEKLTNGEKVTDATVLDVINKGGNGMPGYDELLSAEEKNDVIAYLKTL